MNIAILRIKGKRKMEKPIPSCFKAYDIRGRVPDELNGDLAYRIGRGLAQLFGLRKVVIGRDIRLSGKEIAGRLADGLLEGGCDVLDCGLCGTEEIYHAVFSREDQGVDGGVIVTASHNPAEYNGMKIVMQGARPLSGETGLKKLAQYTVAEHRQVQLPERGRRAEFSCRDEYIEHLLGYIDSRDLAPLKIVVNSGNGCAGPVLDLLEKHLPFIFHKLHHRPDGHFPHGVPNPLLPENREETSRAVIENGADLGLAWDGDFDRCFFWDEKGAFIEGYYIVGLLAGEMLNQWPGQKILHDPRLIWNTIDQVRKGGGVPVMTRTGHAFIKERMRQEDGLYGGEMSAHHYFRDFGYCDSGMIPWLLITSLLSKLKKPLSTLVQEMVAAYPVSGEINSVVRDADAVIGKIEEYYHDGDKEYVDGLSIEYENFRFNIRQSNTEPLLRLNVESRGDGRLMKEKTEELLRLINE
jgi:phosphomannomutase